MWPLCCVYQACTWGVPVVSVLVLVLIERAHSLFSHSKQNLLQALLSYAHYLSLNLSFSPAVAVGCFYPPFIICCCFMFVRDKQLNWLQCLALTVCVCVTGPLLYFIFVVWLLWIQNPWNPNINPGLGYVFQFPALYLGWYSRD